METSFEIKSDGSIPRVIIGGRKLHLVSIAYKWHTATDTSPGENICLVEGYFDGETDLKRFAFDVPKHKTEKGKMQ